jgi:hypothetical protein
MENSGIKKRVGWLKGKSIVEGDKNIVTSNEIHISQLGGSGSGSGSGEGNIAGEYYALKPVEGFDLNGYVPCIKFLGILSEVKFGEYNIIYPTAQILSEYWGSRQFNGPYDVLGRTKAFCFRPIKRLFEGDATVYTFNTLQDALNNKDFDEETRNLILASIEPITEEEFYSFDNYNDPQ